MARLPRQQRNKKTVHGRPQRFTEAEYAEAVRRADGVRRGAARLLNCDPSLITDAFERFPSLLEVEREAIAKVKAVEHENRATASQIALGVHRRILAAAQEKSAAVPPKELSKQELKAIYFELGRSQLGREMYAQRTEVTGKDGAPVQMVALKRDQVSRLSDEEIEGILDGDGRLLADAVAPGDSRAARRGAGAAQARPPSRTTH